MFGNFIKDFEEDPFFSGFPSHFGTNLPIRNAGEKIDRSGDPFQSSFGDMSKLMSEMHGKMNSLKDDQNGYSFSSSSVMSYQNDGKSKPKVFQASTSTRKAPGQVKETHKTLRNSESGFEKMAVGQHLGGKGRVVERRRHHEGKIEEERQYIEMDENDNHSFDKEWEDRTRNISIPTFERTGIGSSNYHKKPPHTRQIQHVQGGEHSLRPHGPSKSGRNKL
uniref:Myeloid leukemia factor 1-like n=1 Tax=Phallusia mammillata TaxID=59560 RepID=A0A6F9DK96_9ASCI|nr:myeloid leukemia factor 1-like [Phallusia mammillata]